MLKEKKLKRNFLISEELKLTNYNLPRKNDHCKQTTSFSRAVSLRATLGFSLGQHARGSIWVVQDRGCCTQRSLTSEDCHVSCLHQHESQGQFSATVSKEKCYICHHLPYHNRFFRHFLSHLNISAICSFYDV